MSYCEKWSLVGLAIGLAPLVAAMGGMTWAARWPSRFWLGFVLAVVMGTVLFATLRPISLVLWNGLRPAICDRID